MPLSLADQLRQAIEDSGLTLYRIAKDSGVHYGMLYRFYVGERDMRLQTADKLAGYFQMRLTRPIKPKKGG